MAASIVCPNCKHQFEATEAFREELEREMNAKAKEWQQKKEKEFEHKQILLQQQLQQLTNQLQQKDKEVTEKLAIEKQKLTAELKEQLQKNIAAEYEHTIKILQQSAQDTEIKLKEARKKEADFLQKELQLKQKEEELEINLQKKLLQEREILKATLAKEEQDKTALKEQEFLLKNKELEKQLEDQKKLVEEMKRKVEQGSMQMQGEIQELVLEELLKQSFPFDVLQPVAKGIRGADCTLTIRNTNGLNAGTIIFESKNTKEFANDWIEKLKADMRNIGADIGVIVTKAMPKDMERFGEKEGIYICNFAEVKSLVLVLRNALLKIAEARKSQENKGDKMVMLYDYLTSSEFAEQWNAIREGFLTMKNSINKERDMMERIWKAREKQIEKVLLNATHFKASIEGIAGSDSFKLDFDEETDKLLEE